MNDNPPVFDKRTYTVSVLESLPANSQFLQVTALDQDTGNNARLTYTIREKEFENVFGVFPNSGSLYLKEVGLFGSGDIGPSCNMLMLDKDFCINTLKVSSFF